jgi:hypothetical protein
LLMRDLCQRNAVDLDHLVAMTKKRHVGAHKPYRQTAVDRPAAQHCRR